MRFTGYILFGLSLLGACKKAETKENIAHPCSISSHNDSISLTSELIPFKDLIGKKTGVYVLEDGGGAMVARAWFSEYAAKTIDIQYFIFSPDNIGIIACDYLVRAADRGVQVRLIIDDIMVDTEIDNLITLDAHKNISIKIYNPGTNLGKNIGTKIKNFTTHFRKSNQRMHNKTFIVDNTIAISGGRNIADEYFDYDHEYNFRDRDVLLIGKEVRNVSKSFEEFWNSKFCIEVTQLDPNIKASDIEKKFCRLHDYACDSSNFWPSVRNKINALPSAFKSIANSTKLVWLDSVYFVSDDPGKNDGTHGLHGSGKCTEALKTLVGSARHSIVIQSPYLVTTDIGRELMRKAISRGVQIKILTNSMASTDNMEAFSGYQRDRGILLETGVEIYEYRPDAAERFKVMTGDLQSTINYAPIFGLHAKSMVVDGKITVIGTFNFDPRSANLNTECVTIIHSKTISAEVLKGMEIEFRPENSWHTTKNFNPDHLAGNAKRIKTWTRKIIPKDIL